VEPREGGAGAGLSVETVLERAPGVLERRTDISVIVLGDAQPLSLRGTGIAVWDAFAAPASIAGVADRLAQAYGVPAETVRREMVPVLEQLCDAHALRIVPPDRSGARSR
jgi:hypothetical protein